MQSTRKSLFTLASAAVLMLLAASAQAATTWNVPGDFATIQSALDAALPGDTILVAPGTYRESLEWVSKDLTLQGAGPGQSIIDPSTAGGGPGGRCLETWYLSPMSTISGFTFQHGYAIGNDGGGMCNNSSNPTVTDCTFTGNSTNYDGGGMYNAYHNILTVTDCTFIGNSANNGSGGGMYNNESSPAVTDCTFTGNSANTGGGMFNISFGGPRLTNCTFTGNTALSYGGAMTNYYNCNPSLINCILWGNSDLWGAGGVFNYAASATITYSDMQDFSNPTPDASGNFAADPLFVDAANGDLHLRAGFPCINAGNNNAVPEGVTTDLDGNPRIADGTVDLGAYEYQRPADTTAPTLTWGSLTPAPNAAGWNNTAVDIPFTTDDDSGVAPSASVSNPIHFGAEGSGQTQTVTITDNAGNSKGFTSPAVNIDWTPPTTSAAASGTTVSTVTLAASDNLSGVKATYYRVDGGAPQTYTGPFTLGQGHYTVQYWSVDKADNAETAKYLDVDTRFAVTVTVASASGKRGSKVSLSATVTQSSNKAKFSGKAVTFTVDGVFAGNAYTSKQGVASLSWTIPTGFATGQHTISAVAQPDGTYKSGYATGTLTVNR